MKKIFVKPEAKVTAMEPQQLLAGSGKEVAGNGINSSNNVGIGYGGGLSSLSGSFQVK